MIQKNSLGSIASSPASVRNGNKITISFHSAQYLQYFSSVTKADIVFYRYKERNGREQEIKERDLVILQGFL